MLRTIIEGEPGIFPDPVARILRGIGGVFRRRPDRDPDAAPAADADDDPPPEPRPTP